MGNFKYLAIVEWAKNIINERQLSEGDHFYSENELCDIHGVSRQTVRQALNTLESQNIITRKRGSGTFVNTGGQVKLPSALNFGVVSTYFSDYIFPSIFTGIEHVLRDRNATMQLSITRNQVAEESRALKALLERDICGLIVEPSKSALPNPNMDLYDKFKAKGIPIVFFNAKYPWSEYPYVSMDDTKAGRIVTDYLFSLGHKDICAIMLLDDVQGHKRYQGYLDSFLAHGIENAEQNVLWYATNERSDFFEASENRIEELVNRSTAIVCYNDNIAVKLLDFCKRRGIRVPEDLSITGMDDSKLSRICEVPITTVRHPHQALGECAAIKLLEMIDNPKLMPEDRLFVPDLIVRNSTAPCTKQDN